jgi:ABC-type histidine transport system ATPase subunit
MYDYHVVYHTLGVVRRIFWGGSECGRTSRIAFIREGRIIDEGPPRRVFHESPEPRLRQFLQTYHDRNSF